MLSKMPFHNLHVHFVQMLKLKGRIKYSYTLILLKMCFPHDLIRYPHDLLEWQAAHACDNNEASIACVISQKNHSYELSY